MDELAAEQIADRFLTDWCKITNPVETGSPTIDPVTLGATFPAASILYEGPCSLNDRRGFRSTEDNLEAVVEDQTELKLPAGSTVAVGQVVDVESKPGVVFEVVEVPARTHEATVRAYLGRRTGRPSTG